MAELHLATITFRLLKARLLHSAPSYKDYNYNKSTPKPTVSPNYGSNSSSNYKYNDYTYSKPKYDIGKPVQPKNSVGYNNQPQTNKNGTVLLKELKLGQSTRSCGWYD